MRINRYNISIMSTDTAQKLLQYPCRFPLKIMGRPSDDLVKLIDQVFSEHVADWRMAEQCKIRPSRRGNFVAYTITFTAQSQAQVDKIYQLLTASKLVLMAL